MDYFYPPQAVPSMTIRGETKRYAVSRIFCVGKNYAAHAREMGSDPSREPPFYFSKPASALTPSGASVPYAPGTQNLHYEMELVIAIADIGKPIFRISPADAENVVLGYACGLDMTRRDLQTIAKNKGQPWDVSKGFEHSAVVSELVLRKNTGTISRAGIRLSVNGVQKQNSDIAEMTWKIPEIISNLSQFYHLGAGDIIYTGTPEGVGPVVAGDKIEGDINGVGKIMLNITAAE